MREPDVADTDRVGRERFTLPLDVPYGTSWMWVAHRTPVLRIPGVTGAVVVLSVAAVVAAIAGELDDGVDGGWSVPRAARSRPRPPRATSEGCSSCHGIRRHLRQVRQQHPSGQSRRIARLRIAKRVGQQRDARTQHLDLRVARLEGRLRPGALHGEALEQLRQVASG